MRAIQPEAGTHWPSGPRWPESRPRPLRRDGDRLRNAAAADHEAGADRAGDKQAAAHEGAAGTRDFHEQAQHGWTAEVPDSPGADPHAQDTPPQGAGGSVCRTAVHGRLGADGMSWAGWGLGLQRACPAVDRPMRLL